MSGEADLGKLLASLSPRLDLTPYVFATLPVGAAIPAGLVPLASFVEAEGLSLVIEATRWPAAIGTASAPYARLTMMVHSSLEAVGMTAALAEALAAQGISANVVAAYYHDHIFVPWDRRHEALAAIGALVARYGDRR